MPDHYSIATAQSYGAVTSNAEHTSAAITDSSLHNSLYDQPSHQSKSEETADDLFFDPTEDYPLAPLKLSQSILAEIEQKNRPDKDSTTGTLQKVGGGLAFHCSVNLSARRVVETASMARLFRGYESLLPGKDLNQVGRVSATASGICGGVHATASALSLEMALGMSPPPLGIQYRNLLLSCQYLNDNTMHLYVLAGPDYSAKVFQQTDPYIWQQAQNCPAPGAATHNFAHIADIMLALNKPDGSLYQQALSMVKLARKAYSLLGGKYPHSESIIPGGVSIQPGPDALEKFSQTLQPFYDFAKQTAAIWDDLFGFLLQVRPDYRLVGLTDANMVDFGQWDHHQAYNARYDQAQKWGEQRWSTPGAVIHGKLVTTDLHQLNAGLEEFVEHAYYQNWEQYPYKTDPVGNPISKHHPWNKRIHPTTDPQQLVSPYSWGTSMTWRRQTFEVGAYARLYISALAQKLPPSEQIQSTGSSLIMHLPERSLPSQTLEWRIPELWNAFERNRARAYALAFNLMVTDINMEITRQLLQQGETLTATPFVTPPSGTAFGVGLWGAGRGFLAHWAVLNDGVIDNYQIAIPSRINAGSRTPWGSLGPLEQAVLNTPILEAHIDHPQDFSAIDLQRCIQSFDPCMTTSAHILLQDQPGVIMEREIDTGFPI